MNEMPNTLGSREDGTDKFKRSEYIVSLVCFGFGQVTIEIFPIQSNKKIFFNFFFKQEENIITPKRKGIRRLHLTVSNYSISFRICISTAII